MVNEVPQYAGFVYVAGHYGTLPLSGEMPEVISDPWFYLFILFIMSYLPRSTPSVRSTVLPGAPVCQQCGESHTCMGSG